MSTTMQNGNRHDLLLNSLLLHFTGNRRCQNRRDSRLFARFARAQKRILL